jgi:SPP1 gp7 family putative phage head morphogenesis protein
LETVFRTNVATSYNVGRHQQMTDPSIKEFFTLWRYNAVDDEATRPSHAAMDGFTAPPDDAIWASWYPPNGFRCRCWVEPVNKFEVEEEDLKPSKSRGVSPDRGFAENPAAHGPFGPEIRR